MVRKVVTKLDQAQLMDDLRRYRQRAVELGASDAKIINADTIEIDERIRAKCAYPRCVHYGTCANCPPYVLELEQVRKIVNRYRYAIFIRLQTPGNLIAGEEARSKRLYAANYNKTHQIVAKIESEAFYDGYYFALGFACGSCKSVFCRDEPCQAIEPGKLCRYPLKSRPSMEAMGMDVFLMAAKVGWDTYPIGTSSTPEETPFGAHYGLVLIY